MRRPPLLMLDGPRATKLVLLVGGLLSLGAWIAPFASRLAAPWLAAVAAMFLLYGALGWLSYRSPRARFVAGALAALLTLAIAWLSFAHLGLLAGGIAVTLGCLVPARKVDVP